MTKKPTPKEIASGIWSLHDKHERWLALCEISPSLPDKLFFKEFVHVWSNSESNDRFLKIIKLLVDRRVVTAERVMPSLEASDRKAYAKLPETFEVYRGTTMENPYCDWSWTIDRDKAEWFSKRCYNGTPAFATGTVRKQDIWFYYNGRGESEVAVLTSKVRNKKLKQVGDWQANHSYGLYAAVQNGFLSDNYAPAFVAMRIAHAMGYGITPEAIKEELYKPVTYGERLGFVTMPRRVRKVLDALNWDELFEQGGKLREAHKAMERQLEAAE